MKTNFLYAFLHMIGRFLFWALFRLETVGAENIPAKGRVILAANHASFLDPILVGTACSRQMFFLAKAELFEGPLFPKFLRKINAIPMNREKASALTFRELRKVLQEEKALLLFPEGTRSKNGKLQEGKPGVAFISYLTSSPVIPTFIENSFKALPPGGKMLLPVKIRIKFGKPLYPQGKSSKVNYQQFTSLIMEEIKKLQSHT
ncbi:MAG: 1-acyl-sn-glycerol-3-phosphate acyltransferase [Caldiserica bacterium]|nr:1-acyl-sn-glycerol-3-phosphate acyltransferase [Caldisericota bacterium]